MIKLKNLVVILMVVIATAAFIIHDAFAAKPAETSLNTKDLASSTLQNGSSSSPSLKKNPSGSVPLTTTPSKLILAGYYTAWSAYSGFTPKQIDPSKLTHISYAFANIGPDLTVQMGYPDIDPHNFQLLNGLKKKNPELKTLISIGGWTWSGRFSDAARTDKTRKEFARSCIAFMKQHGFDGVDIDWEYPVAGGMPSNSARLEDKQNFTLLLKTLREALDEQGAADQRQYLLTIAGGAGTSFARYSELSLIHKYLDFAVIMTYDFHGPWDKYTDFLSPLYTDKNPSPQYQASFDTAVNAWLNASFPAGKLVAGIPFYGYVYQTSGEKNNGLHQSFSNAKAISYKKIAESYEKNPEFRRFFHPETKVPWLYNGSQFISYEDKESISYKSQYIKSKNLAGAMIWELSQDKNDALLNALMEGFK